MDTLSDKFCYFHENTTQFSSVVQSAAHPSVLKNKSICTILSIINLAEPSWVPVDCFQKVLANIACSKAVNQISYHDKPYQNQTKNICRRYEVKYMASCYSFVFSPRLPEKICTQKQITFSDYKADHITMLAKSMAINSMRKTFALFACHKNIFVSVIHRKTWMAIEETVVYNPKVQSGGWFVHSSKTEMFKITQEIIYQCQNGLFISTVNVCDEKDDCGDSSEEVKCNCFGSEHNFYKLNSNNPKDGCSSLYFKDVDKKCKSFLFLVTKNNSSKKDWHSDTKLEKSWSKQHELLCNIEETTCYSFDKICIFTLNENNTLVPCQSGMHIQECRNFDCNFYFKCPGYHCIPWGYLCDGKWDCPYGTDESKLKCGSSGICKGMLKCSTSPLCVHVQELCNGHRGCPQGDDELLCYLWNVRCLPHCVCLNLAIRCKHLNTTTDFQNLPFVSLTLVSVGLFNVAGLLQSTTILVLNLSSNAIKVVCYLPCNVKQFTTLDISNNNLSQLTKHFLVSTSNQAHQLEKKSDSNHSARIFYSHQQLTCD